jgi:NHLM bacteriocin system ABC transporter ATP-binding protein
MGQIRETLSGPVIAGILSGVFSVVNFAMMFVYDRTLALIALGLLLLLTAAFTVSTRLQLVYQRRDSDLAGRLSSTVLELINGVPKLRVAGAETRAFGRWASRFAEQRQVAYSAGQVDNAMAAFNAAYPVLTTLVVFGVFQLALEPKPSIGSLMAFNTAFAAFVAAAISLIQSFVSVIQIIPLYERACPIFQTLPEVDPAQADPGELSGAIEVAHVSFRYKADGPLILDDVSFRCAPGEFIALVGPSGSGKSTLLRLLLGFETPAAGAVLYDGQDLRTLDVRAVRRQIGTVLQSSQVIVGDIFTNIVGASPLTQADAWEACRLAGLDADVRQMPMGLQTMVSEGGSTLSGGQRQRLLIARAMVRRPRLIFFDEATSALDNRTQEIVSRSLDSLDATRVVIAHRLSTIVNADRIYVLQQGRVVESGTYRELMQRRGLFASLARRQIA